MKQFQIISRCIMLAVSVLIITISSKADGFSYNGLNYAITSSSTVAVGYNPDISGDIVIPIVAHHIYTTTNNGVTVQHDDAYTVTGIGTSGFKGSSGLTSISIPNSVTYIEASAFMGCSSLTNITIPNSVTFIGGYVFGSCSNLRSVIIPNSVTYIGDGAFDLCRALTYIDIPNSIKIIRDRTFLGCSSLTNITIPSSITSIGNYAFKDCTGLTRVNITDVAAWCNIDFCNDFSNTGLSNPLSYAHHLFIKDKEITDLVIPETVTTIKDYVFIDCTGLTSVTIPNSVTSIGSYTFNACSNLTSITIPSSITSIGNYAFMDCTGLTRVNITDLAAWCNIDFINDYIHTGFSNPLSYAHHLYLKDKEVTDLVIPETVTTIKDYVFIDCTGLTSITIPDSVTYIGSYTFKNCSGLMSIYSKIKKPQDVTYGASVFINVDKQNCKVYIPKGTLEIYKATAPWKDFNYLIEEEDGVAGDLDGSGIIDVEDVNAAINIILKLKTVGDYSGNADLNGDGIVDVEDVNAIINIILKQ